MLTYLKKYTNLDYEDFYSLVIIDIFRLKFHKTPYYTYDVIKQIRKSMTLKCPIHRLIEHRYYWEEGVSTYYKTIICNGYNVVINTFKTEKEAKEIVGDYIKKEIEISSYLTSL